MTPIFRYRHPVHPPVDARLFQDVVRPALVPLTKDRQVFLMAGDLGGGGSYLQTYYHRDEQFTYVATGMGRTERDGFVVVHIAGGEVELELKHFQSASSDNLVDHNNKYWTEYYEQRPQHAARVDRGASGPARE